MSPTSRYILRRLTERRPEKTCVKPIPLVRTYDASPYNAEKHSRFRKGGVRKIEKARVRTVVLPYPRRREAQERIEKRRKEEDEASFVDLEDSAIPAQPVRPGESAEIDRTVRVRFQREGETTSWDKDTLRAMFSKYGKIDSVVMGKDKKIRSSGSKHRSLVATAFIIYTRIDHAHAAVLDAKPDHPLLESVVWANGEPDLSSSTTTNIPLPSNTQPTPSPIDASNTTAPQTPLSTPNRPSFRSSIGLGGKNGFGASTTPLGTPKFSFSPKTPSLEEVTMMRLKQAEKKRLEDKIRREEAAESTG